MRPNQRLDLVESILIPQPPRRALDFAREVIRFGGNEPTEEQVKRLAEEYVSPERDRMFREIREG